MTTKQTAETKVTAENIEDKQIRRLRRLSQGRLDRGDFGHGDEDVVVACDRALGLDFSDDCNRDEALALYETSRARCAEILSARGGK